MGRPRRRKGGGLPLRFRPDSKTGRGCSSPGRRPGSRPAILAAAGRILEASEAECIDIEIPASDEETVDLPGALGWAGRPSGMHGTLKIIDPRALFSALHPPRQAPAMPTEDLAAFVFGSIEHEITGCPARCIPRASPVLRAELCLKGLEPSHAVRETGDAVSLQPQLFVFLDDAWQLLVHPGAPPGGTVAGKQEKEDGESVFFPDQRRVRSIHANKAQARSGRLDPLSRVVNRTGGEPLPAALSFPGTAGP